MVLSANAVAVLERRYLVKNEAGQVAETPEALFTRVARAVAAVDVQHGVDPARAEEAFFGRMQRLEFLPNSPTLMNSGRSLGQLAACFVIPVGDSMTEIFDAVKWAAQIQQSGGGTGFSFSRLRPQGDVVHSTMGRASGPLAFMDVFNAATDAVKQGGTRRGANMGVLSVDHPDILDFISAKLDPTRLTNFNISVAVTDAFMQALASDGDYPLCNPRTGREVRRIPARRVYDMMVNVAWRTGDPGVIFIDRVNAAQPTPALGLIESTNPCVTGDTRVLTQDLGWVPIRDLVGTTPMIATQVDGATVWRRATRVWRTGTRPILRLRTVEGHELRLTPDHLVASERGDVPAASLGPGDRVTCVLPADREIRFATVATIAEETEEAVFDLTEPESAHFFANGLLVHNCGEQPLLPFESCVLGSLNLVKFWDGGEGVDYEWLGAAVDDGVHFLDNVIDANRYPLPQIESITRRNRKIGLGVMGLADLLVRVGVPYDAPRALALADEVWSFIERRSLEASAALARTRGPFPSYEHSRWAKAGHVPLRNATTTTVAPTGTISIIAGCSSGIEPIFALAYERNVLEGTRLTEAHPIFREVAEARGFWSDELAAELAHRGSARGLAAVPPDVQRLFVSAYDIGPEVHVEMQAAFQRHAHAGVSKTVNFPAGATPADVDRVYRLAYERGCKGVTVYRDTSRQGQVLSVGATRTAPHAPRAENTPSEPRTCPECASTIEIAGGCELCRACGWSLCTV